MNIGFDVDGVLTDLEGFQKRTGTRFFRRGPVYPDAYDVETIFACSHSEREKYWLKYIWPYCMTEPMRQGAAHVSQRLHQQGHRITLVTARVHTDESGFTGWLFRRMLKSWLRRRGFYYDKIVFAPEKGAAERKRGLCLENAVDVLIDDSEENLRAAGDSMKIICFTAAWNRAAHWLDGCRVSNFRELEQRLSEYSGDRLNKRE